MEEEEGEDFLQEDATFSGLEICVDDTDNHSVEDDLTLYSSSDTASAKASLHHSAPTIDYHYRPIRSMRYAKKRVSQALDLTEQEAKALSRVDHKKDIASEAVAAFDPTSTPEDVRSFLVRVKSVQAKRRNSVGNLRQSQRE